MKKFLIIMAIIVAVVVLSVFAVFSVQNKADSYEGQIFTIETELSIHENKKIDLVSNLIDCIKQYNPYEHREIMVIINTKSLSSDEVIEEILNKIVSVADARPEFKSSANYIDSMNELTENDELIANANDNLSNLINEYNAYIKKFPNNYILSIVDHVVNAYQNIAR